MSTIEIILTVFCLVLSLLVWRILDEVQAVRYRTNRLMEECNVSFFPKVKTPTPPDWIKERTVRLNDLQTENERLKDVADDLQDQVRFGRTRQDKSRITGEGRQNLPMAD